MLTQLSIHHLRNLQSVTFEVATCNVFIGANGSGKTSLLESLHLLSRGKSFRHAQPKRYISHYHPHTIVHAKFTNRSSMAIQKSQDASTILRLGQQTVYVQSTLAKQLPTLLIDPSSMDLLEVGSNHRRQLLDWITFHVKQGFHSQWVSYQRLLKQRNALLKETQQLSSWQKQELASWDKGLANHAALITHYRQSTFTAWQPLFENLVKQLLPEHAPYIQLRFSAGYNTDIPFDELLQQRLPQDSRMGYTRVGCHRADVQVLWVNNPETRQQTIGTTTDDNKDDNDNEDSLNVVEISGLSTAVVREQAANVLSRGEKKLLITALRLSQLPLLTTSNNPTSETFPNLATFTTSTPQLEAILPLVLLDDITAELDDNALAILLSVLSKLECQVFITSLDESILEDIKNYWSDTKMFHVKQGKVTPMGESH